MGLANGPIPAVWDGPADAWAIGNYGRRLTSVLKTDGRTRQ